MFTSHGYQNVSLSLLLPFWCPNLLLHFMFHIPFENSRRFVRPAVKQVLTCASKSNFFYFLKVMNFDSVVGIMTGL
jgi:hypothetical protein